VQVLMVNEFRDVPAILFNPKNEDGSEGKVSIITGLLWLLDLGIDPVAHSHLMAQGLAVMAGVTLALLVLAYAVLARSRYLK
jgi:hypothetical protein